MGKATPRKGRYVVLEHVTLQRRSNGADNVTGTPKYDDVEAWIDHGTFEAGTTTQAINMAVGDGTIDEVRTIVAVAESHWNPATVGDYTPQPRRTVEFSRPPRPRTPRASTPPQPPQEETLPGTVEPS